MQNACFGKHKKGESKHLLIRNRLEPCCVEKLLYVQINNRQLRADRPPIITQEMFLDEEDAKIERILQPKHIQDYPGTNCEFSI
jgi:hypothetical protein